MSNLKGLHTADNHLGFRQYGLVQRERDIEDSFTRIINYAISNSVDYITVSGDLINVKYPSVNVIKYLSDINMQLMQAGIPMLVISGNHDGGIKNANWSSVFNEVKDGEDLCRKGGIYDIDFKRVWIDGLTIYGCPYVYKSTWLDIQKELPNTDILLMHQTFEDFFGIPSANSFNAAQDIADKFKLVIVGDIHVSELQNVTVKEESADGTKKEFSFQLLSPGSTELMSKSESESKVIWLSEFDLNDVVVQTPIPITTRPVHRLKVSTNDALTSLIENDVMQKRNPILFLEIDIPDAKSILNKVQGIDKLNKNTIFRPYFSPNVFNLNGDVVEEISEEEMEGETLDMVAKSYLDSLSLDGSPEEVEQLATLVMQGLNPETNFKKEVAYFVDSFLS